MGTTKISTNVQEKCWDFVEGETFTAVQESENVWEGTSSCSLDWTAKSGQRLFQSWYMPATPGSEYTITVYMYDGDGSSDSFARPGLYFYDSAKEKLADAFGTFSGNTDDGEPAWELEQKQALAPEGTAYQETAEALAERHDTVSVEAVEAGLSKEDLPEWPEEHDDEYWEAVFLFIFFHLFFKTISI